MQLSEAWALARPTKPGYARGAGYVGTHKTGSISGAGHAAYHKSLAGSEGERVTLNKRKDGTTDVYRRKVAEQSARERMLTREDVVMEEKTEKISPDPIHHDSLTKIGLKHERSERHHGKYGGDHHGYSADVGRTRSRYDDISPPNTKRSSMIKAVTQHFTDRGYTHVATKGKQGIHWFSKRGPHDTEPGVAAKVGARMDTAHGHLYVHVHDYRKPKE